MTTRFGELLSVLSEADVEFILIGGLAAIAHGAARLTQDIDVVYGRDEANMGRLVDALRPHDPYLRGAPPGLPFQWDVETLRRGLNFTLTTDLGPIDLMADVPGGRTYEELRDRSLTIEFLGHAVRVVDLPTLVHLKRAAGRPKDLEAIAELESLMEELE